MMKSVIILNQLARSVCMGKCSLSRIAGVALTFRTLNENENWRKRYNNHTNTSGQQEMRSLFPKPHRKKQNSRLTNTHMNMLGLNDRISMESGSYATQLSNIHYICYTHIQPQLHPYSVFSALCFKN